ncbi:hypothetical protein AWB79_03111 [Caballeronia hypogeia]|uniref:Uncharacterized protein n=1 Tax=Caballeronia hypogeia TaxID=1777140 RepID=A0A158B2J3_9BURK|nr:hypothetical protein [Caballeronia hypogeia]SAK64391.1 hypothetical protein AWB79_03111 [Caballeronia hypogeia]
MRTRTREVVRMLATFRHSAQCSRLRAAAAAQEVRDLANEEADDAVQEDDERAQSGGDALIGPRKPHPGMH